ncbi:MAG: hypothetical protein ACRCXT_10330 [Paraclostridium sp.]
MSNNNVSSGGIGFCGMLGILFIGLKLTGYVSWAWWLVLLPLYWWIPFIILILMIAVVISVIKN